jgi:hypothetical protein
MGSSNASAGELGLRLVEALFERSDFPLSDEFHSFIMQSDSRVALKAARLGAVDVARQVEKSGGQTLLMVACCRWPDIAEELILLAADTTGVDGTGETALTLLAINATHPRAVHIAQALVERGIDVKHKNRSGLTAREIAMLKGTPPLSRYLWWKMRTGEASTSDLAV